MGERESDAEKGLPEMADRQILDGWIWTRWFGGLGPQPITGHKKGQFGEVNVTCRHYDYHHRRQ